MIFLEIQIVRDVVDFVAYFKASLIEKGAPGRPHHGNTDDIHYGEA
jgi:hypothetical protein